MDVYDDADVDYSGNLCLFLDSASEEEWAKWLPSGIFAGVTTNPIILERDGRECNVAALTELARQALEYDAVQEFQVQTWGESSDEMWKNGIALAKYDPDVIVVKVPATFDGHQSRERARRGRHPSHAHRRVRVASGCSRRRRGGELRRAVFRANERRRAGRVRDDRGDAKDRG